ncbi:amidohydrolase [Variovorax sp. OV329]|uniref:amidohydrolase family protein n=1 Tax=Variovorax sp. OV329 TaxID=1882825 RepID=UPI0008E480FC|nr:amidohydrolase family protein [Variovorax sp. OV329]SFM98803.1 2-pyrone-4,6-dicarboxylate lactonase [Variovorax sp. OV329]
MDTREPTWHPNPGIPALALPPLACDAHVHVFGPLARFPFDAASAIRPGDAPREALFALHRRLGIGRCVIVQSLVHGFDNRVVEDAIAAGGGRYLGVALVPSDVPDAELARLAAAGLRGVRFNFMSAEAVARDAGPVLALTRRLAALDMHLQLQIEGPLIHSLARLIGESAVQVVIDHMGRVDAALGPGHADFRALRSQLRAGRDRTWVKLSGIDRISKRADYSDGIELAGLLAAEFPDQCVWGTDWPHPNHWHVPDDGALVDALARIAPSATLREQILVRNPADLYRFEPA